MRNACTELRACVQHALRLRKACTGCVHAIAVPAAQRLIVCIPLRHTDEIERGQGECRQAVRTIKACGQVEVSHGRVKVAR